MKYFEKIAEKNDNNKALMTGLAFGGISGLASTTASHPIEHKLYGKDKTFFKHLGARMTKGVLASAVGYGTYHYLSTNEEKIKDFLGRVKKSY